MKGKISSVQKSYHSIASDLVAKINAGLFAEGTFLPIERDLISVYGVTRTTIRRALAALVEEGHGQLVPNKGVLAVRKSAPGSKAIAFIDGSTLVLRSLYAQLNAAFLNLDYHLVHIDSQLIGLENALLFAQDRHLEGAFVWSFEGFPDVELLERIQAGMPIVALDHRLGSFDSDIVTFDYFQMAQDATGHLIRSGRKRVAVTGMLDMLDTTHDRFSGYMRGQFVNGRSPDVRDFVFCHTSGYAEPNYEQLMNRLRDPDRPDALFVMQDEFVPGVVDAVLQCGLSIPGDIAVATIGDDVVVTVEGQEVTAVRCDWEGFSQEAMNLMLKRIREPAGPRMRIVGRHELVPGGPSERFAAGAHAHTYMVTRRRRTAGSDSLVNK